MQLQGEREEKVEEEEEIGMSIFTFLFMCLYCLKGGVRSVYLKSFGKRRQQEENNEKVEGKNRNRRRRRKNN